MRTLSAILLLGLLSVGELTAQTPNARQAEVLKKWLKKYPEADANKDGKLTLEEARAYRAKITQNPAVRKRAPRIKPTNSDVKYGPFPRNVFDIWLPKSPHPTYPVYVFFHGGGFVAGDKSGFNPSPFLQAGMAVVSANYRFVDGSTTLSPAPMQDAARVIQFLRHRSKDWNLDTDRIVVSGSSAGAVISLWIGYHDDLAQPGSDDLVERESSRAKCIVPINGPTNLDPDWITRNMGGPKHVHGSFPKMFGAPVMNAADPDVRKRILESSPIEHASKEDPPTLLIYTGKPDGIPLPETVSTGVLIHHAYFGKVLKSRLDELGVPNVLRTGTDPRQNQSAVILDWLKPQLFPANKNTANPQGD